MSGEVLKTRAVNLRKSTYDVYVGRAGHGKDGYFGNPVRTGCICEFCGNLHVKPKDTIPCYKTYLVDRLKTDNVFRGKVRGLIGLKLGCFCIPKPCHATYLARAVEVLNG